MRQVLAVAVVMMVATIGCRKSSPGPAPGVCTGDVTISNGTELAAFVTRDCTSVTGTLSIKGSDLTSLDLPGLITVGKLEVTGNTGLVGLNLPALTHASSLVITGNTSLRYFGLPVLTTVSGDWTVTGNTAFPQCAAEAILAKLTAAPTSVDISGNDTTATCPLPCTPATASATTDRGDGTTILVCGAEKVLICTNPDCSGITGLTISGTDLTRVDLSTLTNVRLLVISGNPTLARVALPSLGSISAFGGGYLRNLGRSLTISNNPALMTVELPALQIIDDELHITGNTAFPQCQAETIQADLTYPPRFGSLVSGNGASPLCPPSVVCLGDVTIATSAEMEALIAQGCTSVTGTLTIIGTDLTNVDLPALRLVARLRVSGNVALTTLGFPALTTGDLSVSGSALSGLELPALRTGILSVTGTGLPALSLPLLTRTRALTVTDNPALSNLAAPKVTSTFLTVSRNQVLPGVSLPALTYGVLLVAGSTALTSLSLPALIRASWLDISDNTGLTTVNVPALARVDSGFTIRGNTSYPQCAAEAILAKVVNASGAWTISGNDTTATCPP
jgi:hypothetical protein